MSLRFLALRLGVHFPNSLLLSGIRKPESRIHATLRHHLYPVPWPLDPVLDCRLRLCHVVIMRRRKGSSTPRLLGDILPETLRKKSLYIPVKDRALVDTWNRAVGPQIAAKAQPDRLKDDILYVRVANSVWLHELQFMKQEILAKLNAIPGAGRVAQMRFFIGTVEATSSRPVGAESPLDPRDLKSDEKEFIEETLTGVSDPELKDILQRTMARSILRGRKGS